MNPTNKQKIKEWVEKLKVLEEVDLPKAKLRVGEAAQTGDWQENAEYEDAERQLEVLQSRMDDIKGVIKKLKSEKPKKS